MSKARNRLSLTLECSNLFGCCTNFSRTLPPEQAQLAVQVLRNPYNFDFLTLTHPLEERKLERGLLLYMRDLLLELGRNSTFVGSQVPLTVADQTFYLDLLFYHVRLHCYVVVELKVGKFRPEYAGKLNFYLSAVDGEIRTERDEPTIGLLLCESHEGAIVGYSFKDITKPIGVASYRVTRELPSPIQDELPSIQDLEGIVAKLRVDLGAEMKDGYDA